MDKDNASKTADKHQAKARTTWSRREHEKLLVPADVFRFIEATLGEQPAFMTTPRRRASKHA